MGNIGEPITPAIPVVGSSGPQFATDINAILTEVVARLSVKVPLSSVNFAADFNMAGSKLLNVGYMTLQNEAISPVASPSNRVTSFNGDFWWVSPSGAVQITTGNALNSASIGGITGDYGGANPAQFRFVAVDSRYNAYSNFGTNTLGFVRALGFDMAPTATSAVRVRLAANAATASDKTYTFPVAPASIGPDKPLYMDSSGNIKVGHGTRSYTYSAFGAWPALSSGVFNTNIIASHVIGTVGGGGMVLAGVNTTGAAAKAVDGIPVGFKITSIDFHLCKVGTTNTAFDFIRRDGAGLATTLVQQHNTTTNGQQITTMTLGVPESVSAATSYFINWFPNGGSNAGECWHGFVINGTMDP